MKMCQVQSLYDRQKFCNNIHLYNNGMIQPGPLPSEIFSFKGAVFAVVL